MIKALLELGRLRSPEADRELLGILQDTGSALRAVACLAGVVCGGAVAAIGAGASSATVLRLLLLQVPALALLALTSSDAAAATSGFRPAAGRSALRAAWLLAALTLAAVPGSLGCRSWPTT